jgi:thymidylate synthase ThyX
MSDQFVGTRSDGGQIFMPPTYFAEEFTDEETAILNRHFTNLDLPVFALQNLPEVVKAALFARYSRTPLSLRRLFLTEFVDLVTEDGELSRIGLSRSESLLERVLGDYGDDSVAQMGGAHLACEQASNILTKILEWGRLMSYIEQSTRYVAYDQQIGGNYRYYRDPKIWGIPGLGEYYSATMDWVFDEYSTMIETLRPVMEELIPRQTDQSPTAYRAAVRSKVLDSLRGLLPAATTSNLGIFASGQAFEQLLMRMRAHPLPEAREYSEMMLTELRKDIEPFLKRVDLPSRGNMWSGYLEDNRIAMKEVVEELLGDVVPEEAPEVTLVNWDPDGEIKLVAGALYESSAFSLNQLMRLAEKMSVDDRIYVLRQYFGDRSHNRRHKPGRALELTDYTFDILSDYGSFRDLQRHRLLTVVWQQLTPVHGYRIPVTVQAAGMRDRYVAVLECQRDLHRRLAEYFPLNAQPGYAVGMAYHMRYLLKANARELTHMLELRTGPQGHDDYRRICQSMHADIRDQAGHKAVAGMMVHVDYERYDLGRISAEERLASKPGGGISD